MARNGGARRAALLAGLSIALCASGGAVLAGPQDKAAGGPVTGPTFARRYPEYTALARVGGKESLSYLIAAYRHKDWEPTERARIVSIACDAFPSPEGSAAIREWREKEDGDDAAWLWYRSLRREVGESGGATAEAVARDPAKRPALRAAAIRALAAWSDPACLGVVAALARSDLGKDPGRAMLVEALAEALQSQAGRIGSPALRDAFEALLPFLRKGVCEPRTRLLVARSLSRMLDAPKTPLDPSVYAGLLEHREAPVTSDDEDRYAPPRFFGLEATGDRVVYVVDESGSMTSPLTKEERDDLRKAAEAAKAKGDPMASVDWEKVATRRDAAVAMTNASIRALPPTASFAVVVFDSAASWVGTPFELLPATPANVDAVTKELSRTQRTGSTNLHGGLRRAFEAVVGGRKEKAPVGATVDVASLLKGPTTVFLLTDGQPCADDWGMGGGRDAPFNAASSLADDAERLDLYRGAEIHAVGIGEAEGGLLDLLAHVGRGKVKRIGHPKGGWLSSLPSFGDLGGGRSVRDLVRRLKEAGLPVPKALQDLADEEEKAEKQGKTPKGAGGSDPAAGGGAPAPAPAPPPGPDPDVKALRENVSSFARRNAATRLGLRRYALAVPDLAHALVDDGDGEVSVACEEALRAIAGRGFRPWIEKLPPHEKESLRRNWGWWWDIHREAIEKAALEKSTPPGPSAPAPGAPTPDAPAPAK